jgi:hypothetical protein
VVCNFRAIAGRPAIVPGFAYAEGQAVGRTGGGELFIDQILSGLQAPGWGEVFARKYWREVGGGAAITACGLSRLGTRVGVLGVVGCDGDWLIQRLAEWGVDELMSGGGGADGAR